MTFGMKSRLKQIVGPRIVRLVLAELHSMGFQEQVLGNPFVSAKLIPVTTNSSCRAVAQTRAEGTAVPVPPKELWEGYDLYGGEQAYLAGGQSTMQRMLQTLETAGAHARDMSRVLELGCASARVLRHFPHTNSGVELWGVDIKGKHITWCQQNLGTPFRFVLGTTYPHLPFPDAYFDLIYCQSVFTHISDLADAWLLELLRVTKPRGHIFATVHDENSISFLLRSKREDLSFLIDALHAADAETNVLSSDYGYFSIGTEPRTQVFYNSKYLVQKWAAFAQVVSVNSYAEEYQSSILLRKLDG